jgi:hypothetical protein
VEGEGLAHLFGDYVVQSHYMATEKVRSTGPALAHAATYAACFLPLTRSARALAFIGGTHFVIDRWRLARHVVYVKNQAAPERHRYPWSHARATGYHDGRGDQGVGEHTLGPDACGAPAPPPLLALGLLIVADNALHLALNRWALRRWAR